MYWTAVDVVFFSICHTLKTWFERSSVKKKKQKQKKSVKLYGNRVRTVLKRPCIPFFLEKSLNFL